MLNIGKIKIEYPSLAVLSIYSHSQKDSLQHDLTGKHTDKLKFKTIFSFQFKTICVLLVFEVR